MKRPKRGKEPKGPKWSEDAAILIGAFIVATAGAAVLGAHNFGTALFFGQVAFAMAVVAVILRR
jgi:geranylgeranyl pyrophosphate synthase